MENLWKMGYGLAKIIEGVIIVCSLGFCIPPISQNVSLRLARWRMKKDQKLLDISDS